MATLIVETVVPAPTFNALTEAGVPVEVDDYIETKLSDGVFQRIYSE